MGGDGREGGRRAVPSNLDLKKEFREVKVLNEAQKVFPPTINLIFSRV
jgi:hypothetical protein